MFWVIPKCHVRENLALSRPNELHIAHCSVYVSLPINVIWWVNCWVWFYQSESTLWHAWLFLWLSHTDICEKLWLAQLWSNSQELPQVSIMNLYWTDNCEIVHSRALREWTLLSFLGGTQKDQRWQDVNYNDLTCHVAVYLCGPQGTTPIRINGVVARGAANQLVGLTRWLVDGWKKQSGDTKQLFPRESAEAPGAS